MASFQPSFLGPRMLPLPLFHAMCWLGNPTHMECVWFPLPHPCPTPLRAASACFLTWAQQACDFTTEGFGYALGSQEFALVRTTQLIHR